MGARAVGSRAAQDEDLPEPGGACRGRGTVACVVANSVGLQHRQSAVPPEPPLFGLDVMFLPDPPNFRSLTPTPELRQVVASSWEALWRGWTAFTTLSVPEGEMEISRRQSGLLI